MSGSWRRPVERDGWWSLRLALGLVTGVFAGGRWAFPAAAWLSPLFLVRFVRTQRPLRGFAIGAPGVALIPASSRRRGHAGPALPGRLDGLSLHDVRRRGQLVRARRVLAVRQDAEWERVGERTAEVRERLFARSVREARAGARMIFRAEANGPARAEDEAASVDRGAALARDHDVYLDMSLLVLPRDVGERLENKIVLLSPEGAVLEEYHKSIPVPGFEARLLKRGERRQAGLAGADLLVGPSDDRPEVARTHAEMATFRAIEQGVSLVRPTTGGISIAADPYGRTLASMDFARSKARSVSALVPVRPGARPEPRSGSGARRAAIDG
ncbi:MAG: hypothetical protein ACODAE_06805 [Gemmatimonadota bacterium]